MRGIMFKEDLREYTRLPFISIIRYSVSVVDSRELKKISEGAVSVDICKGGLGMIANYPLEAGHVLVFEDEIKTINHIKARAAIVRWTGKLEDDKYRVGVEFV